MPPAPDLDELAQRQAPLIAELNARMTDVAGISRLREISDGGALKLDAVTLGASSRTPLTVDEMKQIVDRATLLLSSFYVHLTTKRALYASDPLQALRNLKSALGAKPTVTEEQFHDRMTAIFVGLRDCHTNYYLPAPYRRTIAFLPLLIESAMDPVTRSRRYVVTKVAGEHAADEVLRPARDAGHLVEVTHVNGVPIEQVVARLGAESSGATPDARRARGVDRLTFRWLGLGTGPREDWVDLRLTIDGQAHERRFEWLAARQQVMPADRSDPGVGEDLEGQWIRRVKKGLYFQPDDDSPWVPIGGDAAAYRTYPAEGNDPEYGYLRIFTFEVLPARVPEFVQDVANILRRAPEGGVVIDVRGNPGGNVHAAEGLLPLFAANPIARQSLQFLNTPEAIGLAGAVLGNMAVGAPARLAEAAAAPFVFFPDELMARPQTPTRQVYQGPVVVIVDANCYSASEMFAAGMQDHRLASIIGTHAQTGGAGAIVSSDEAIARICRNHPVHKLLGPLPRGASFEVAVLRTTRAGEHAGVAVEDMGVVTDRNDRHEAHRQRRARPERGSA